MKNSYIFWTLTSLRIGQVRISLHFPLLFSCKLLLLDPFAVCDLTKQAQRNPSAASLSKSVSTGTTGEPWPLWFVQVKHNLLRHKHTLFVPSTLVYGLYLCEQPWVVLSQSVKVGLSRHVGVAEFVLDSLRCGDELVQELLSRLLGDGFG